jgi:ATP-dependent Clp protease ATP-binding subunit ClpA
VHLKLNPEMAQALTFASEEASAFECDRLKCEHLLIGIIRLDKVPELLALHKSASDVRLMVEMLTGKAYSPARANVQTLELDDTAKLAFSIAEQIVIQLDVEVIELRHLLCALASEYCNESREILQRIGFDFSNFDISRIKLLLPRKNKLTVEEIKKQISTWAVRAEMAEKQGRQDLVESALHYKAEYELKLRHFQQDNGK